MQSLKKACACFHQFPCRHAERHVQPSSVITRCQSVRAWCSAPLSLTDCPNFTLILTASNRSDGLASDPPLLNTPHSAQVREFVLVSGSDWMCLKSRSPRSFAVFGWSCSQTCASSTKFDRRCHRSHPCRRCLNQNKTRSLALGCEAEYPG